MGSEEQPVGVEPEGQRTTFQRMALQARRSRASVLSNLRVAPGQDLCGQQREG